MTVLIYVNTSKQVGDPEHLKVFANADASEAWFEENDPKASLSKYEVLEWAAPLAPEELRAVEATCHENCAKIITSYGAASNLVGFIYCIGISD